MILEARPARWLDSTLVLKRNDQPIGQCTRRWFSENRDIALRGHRQLAFEKTNWSSHFVLKDAVSDRPFGAADRSGWLTSTWDLELSVGPAHLVRAGWLTPSSVVRQGDTILARVDRLGLCRRGWSIQSEAALTEEDLILIGLVYQTIHQRRARAH